MYQKSLLVFLFLVVVSFLAPFANAAHNFSCADSAVKVYVEKTGEHSADAVITVTKNGRSTVLRHTQIDRIGGICTTTTAGRQFILYQAVCGGSGCKDADNWGIIDPKDLRVLLVPSDTNQSEATKILGKQPEKLDDYLNIEKEKIKLGVKLL